MGFILEWIGGRARWVLAAGVLAAFFMPGLSAALRPVLSILVGLVFCAAMARIDIQGLAGRLCNPRHLGILCLWSVGLMGITPCILWGLGTITGLPEPYTAALVYTSLAPPITSAAALCLIIGLNAGFALELTMVASLLTPLIGPVVGKLLLGEAVPIDALSLGLRVAGIVLGGALGAIALRLWLGGERIERNSAKFDGVSAIVMWLVVAAVLDGAGARILADPLLAVGVFALAVAANFGSQAAVAFGLRRGGNGIAGAAGLMWGNRTVALYLAALPFEPVFALYVAFFQVPMLFTPLIMGRFLSAAERSERMV
ncbi:MAG: hypothetical protein AAF317_03285 [Pseudomonadota bacterium]